MQAAGGDRLHVHAGTVGQPERTARSTRSAAATPGVLPTWEYGLYIAMGVE
jgi:hypothetical protein